MGNKINKPINKYNDTILIQSIKDEDFEYTNKLLNEPGIDVNKMNIFGDTPISLAAMSANTDLLIKLINKNANINIKRISKDKYVKSIEDTPLIITVKYTTESYLKNLKILLKCKDLKINYSDKYGKTALITCVFSDNLRALKELLKNKEILVNKQDKKGNTALMYAVKNNSIDIIKELLKDERININIKNLEGKTVLDLADNNKVKNLLSNFIILKSKKEIPFQLKSNIDNFF